MMKKILTMILMVVVCVTMYAQNKKYYCEVLGMEKVFTPGLKIDFDFGNNRVYSVSDLRENQKIVDENGKKISFNSMVDAGNYMADKGWTFVQTYTSISTVYDSRSIIHWIFCKEASSLEEAVAGILTKEEFYYNK